VNYGRKEEKKNASKPVSGHLFFSLLSTGKKKQTKRERVVRLRRSVSDALE
jgi:hypothetical protein